MREFNVVDGLRRDLGDECGGLAFREAKAWRRPFVKPLAELAHRCIAALGDIGDDGLNRAPDLGIGFFLLAGQRRPFDVPRHNFLLFDDLVGAGQDR